MGSIIPVSQMDDMIEYMSQPLSDSEVEEEDIDLEEREQAFYAEEAEVLAALRARVEESFAILKHLHAQLKSVTIKTDRLTQSIVLLKEEQEKTKAILASAFANLQKQTTLCQHLKGTLYRLEQKKANQETRLNGHMKEGRNRITETALQH